MVLQVAIWRDSARKRLVVAFRGTEQVGNMCVCVCARVLFLSLIH